MKKDKLAKIKEIFTKAPVDVVYLFGSQARNDSGPMSDYDFGILSSKKHANNLLAGYLMDKLSAVIGQDKVEVVNLEDKPILFRFKVIKDGKLILNRNEKKRIQFELKTMREFHDQKPYFDQEILTSLDQIEKGVFFDRRLLTHYKTA